jgi:glycosyltransferase involved in cell wall biosynthesis
VIVGKALSDDIHRQISQLGIADQVLHLKGLSGPDLEWLYSNAWGLLMTSFDEGFGLPIIEAQNCGCPVFATDKEPMTEIGGAGAVYIDPSNPKGAAEKIMENYASFADLRKRGYDNAKNYTTEAMVADYAQIYRDLRSELAR